MDAMPDNPQGSEWYEKVESVCPEIEYAVSYLEDTINSIEAAIE